MNDHAISYNNMDMNLTDGSMKGMLCVKTRLKLSKNKVVKGFSGDGLRKGPIERVSRCPRYPLMVEVGQK